MEEVMFNLKKTPGNLIKVIGVGGAGSNAVIYMSREGIKDVSYAICNTDLQALESSGIGEFVQLGRNLTRGLGAGNKAERGEAAAEECVAQINDLIEESTRMVFITAGMGGGTGTGASPVVARICKEKKLPIEEHEMLVVGIVTLPFRDEGPYRVNQAREGIEKLSKYVDSLVIIDSEYILREYGDLLVTKAFAEGDKLLYNAAKGIAEIVTTHGPNNINFSNVKNVLIDGGLANMGVAVVSGEDRARRATLEAISSPLLIHSDIRGAARILVNIASSRVGREVTMREKKIIKETLQEKAGGNASIVDGTTIDDSLGDALRVTIIVTKFSHEIKDVFDIEATEKTKTTDPAQVSFAVSSSDEEGNQATRVLTEEEEMETPAYNRSRMK
ncbi:MAG: cell division protein FtsZ [Mangrovibacterium sp.]